jgi:hypothetical protein
VQPECEKTMWGTSQFVILVLFFFLPSSLFGQVIFSRRVYKERGPSYQQIWLWNPTSGPLKVLTHSPRNHFFPACAGGKITFVSSEEEWGDNSKLWSFDPESGDEREIGPAPMPPQHETTPKNGCYAFAKAGRLEACGKDEDLSITRGEKAIGRLNIQSSKCPIDNRGTIGKCNTPIWTLEWSPHAKWLLVGEQGLDSHQMDYYVVEPVTMKLTEVGSADDYAILWLPGREELLYTTPQGLAPLPGAPRERNVWVQQLILFNPATGKSTAITSGVTNNFDASLCQPYPSPPRRAVPAARF